MRSAILGGTFNPVHIGHLVLAEAVRDGLQCNEVLFVPTNLPSHKGTVAVVDAAHRVRMLELAIDGISGFSVDRSEVDRGGVSYTVDTIRDLIARGRCIAGETGLIIGADLAGEFDQWREPDTIARLVRLIVAGRGEEASPPLAWDHVRVSGPRLDISSSMIRERVSVGRSIRFLVPEAVRGYVARHGLYGSEVIA